MLKKELRAIRKMIEDTGVPCSERKTGKAHIFFTFELNGKKASVTLSGTSSCRHAAENFKKDVARALKSVGYKESSDA